jgi:hypothetical protein
MIRLWIFLIFWKQLLANLLSGVSSPKSLNQSIAQKYHEISQFIGLQMPLVVMDADLDAL